MVFNTPDMYLQEQYQIGLPNAQLINNQVPLVSTNMYQEPLFLNLSKKNKPDSQLSSAQTTPRDSREQHSQNKYPGSKISLSQIKKSQAEGDSTPSHGRNIPIMINSLKGQADFKKQSRTMAIQYKNKIKDHINKM